MNPLVVDLATLASRHPVFSAIYINYGFVVHPEFMSGVLLMFILVLHHEVVERAE